MERVEDVYSARWLMQEDEAAWDRFVLQHPSGSIYHTVQWKKTLEQAFPHIRGRFLVLKEGGSGRIQAGLPIYRVNSWLLGSRLVSIPFATVCDPLVSSLAEWKALAPELEAERGRTGSHRLEIRAMLSDRKLPASFGCGSLFKHHALALDMDLDDLCSTFDKRSVRQKAEKARRAGITIEERSDTQGMEISHSLLAATRRRLSLPPMPYRFFDALLSHLRPCHLRIFLARQGAEPIACHLILIFKDQWISEYSGNADGVLSGVNQLLYLETIRRAWAAGAKNFSFGRTSNHNEGLLSYKRRWGTVEEPLMDYTMSWNRGTLDPVQRNSSTSEMSRLYQTCKQMIAKAPLPFCRMIGDFCYRHLG